MTISTNTMLLNWDWEAKSFLKPVKCPYFKRTRWLGQVFLWEIKVVDNSFDESELCRAELLLVVSG